METDENAVKLTTLITSELQTLLKLRFDGIFICFHYCSRGFKFPSIFYQKLADMKRGFRIDQGQFNANGYLKGVLREKFNEVQYELDHKYV